MTTKKKAKQQDATPSLLSNKKGSIWHRWEPHIHTPETKMNDQFGGEEGWEAYLDAIEKCDPPIRALGVTDYCSVDNYEKLLAFKQKGRLPQVELIFANIEFRLTIGTSKGPGINIHLLASPDAPNHIESIKTYLSKLSFKALGDTFGCSPQELIKLGKAHNSSCKDDSEALEEGINQFKLDLNALKELIDQNDWFRENILIAVSGGSSDGTSGLQKDASFATLRKEIERTAQVIFASSEKQAKFWNGEGAATKEELEQWNGQKPCLHGSDAHDLDKVGKPDDDRYNWIKGDLQFETLKQAIIEPRERVHVGASPPYDSLPSYTISEAEFPDSDWISPKQIPLNSGLVTIIGARGSGKTALADLIAVAGLSSVPFDNTKSFRTRAAHLFGLGENTKLIWASNEFTEHVLDEQTEDDEWEESHVQYLSQQFVERLCSAEGMTDELIQEIERIIFQAHQPDQKAGTATFQELLNLKTTSLEGIRKEFEQQIADYSDEVNALNEKSAQKQTLEKQLSAKKAGITRLETDRQKLLGNKPAKDSAGNDLSQKYQEVTTALDAVRLKLEQETKRKETLIALKDNLGIYRDTKFPDALRRMKTEYSEAGLSSEQWNSFQIGFKGEAEKIVDDEIKKSLKAEKAILGDDPVDVEKLSDLNKSLLPAGKSFEELSYNLLQSEVARIDKLIGIDKDNAQKVKQLNEKLQREQTQASNLEAQIEASKNADEQVPAVQEQRKVAYKSVFDTLIRHQQILVDLYAPLVQNMSEETGALQKLTFHVERKADIEAWATVGESLLDLRKGEQLKGRGSLQKMATEALQSVWETGSSADVAEALQTFLADNRRELQAQCNVSRSDLVGRREWTRKLAKWLFSTKHISIQYGVQFDGVEIQKLSPGTRGIVLLLLYLAVDKDDYRPLIIDQPEENLDPQSIFDELVPRFKEAKRRRQIIIVTHNANLVVNTDSEQVIVASCGPHQKDKLPNITYVSGGLENPEIRQKVCDILEGGQRAFRERAKRLRVKF